ncbi:hypothetical protein [Oceanimonas marisflavi]|uniref:hypothetical protein n=1 Tax=Oceanimonas marisflavi TaxID=2059724 RepID=UPI0018E4EEAA|nr:hypothetical protein [Oceanimonas marisflavi]
MADSKTIEQVLYAYRDEWMALPEVEGTGIGLCEGTPCIKVYSSRITAELRSKIPLCIEGYPVIIEETGSFRAWKPGSGH